MIATEETATFICPTCGQEFEVHGWIVVDDKQLVFKTAPGLRPRCDRDIFTELIINSGGIGYGGPIT